MGKTTSGLRSKSEEAALSRDNAALMGWSGSSAFGISVRSLGLKSNRGWIEIIMSAAELAVSSDTPVFFGHRGDVLGRVYRQRLTHTLLRTGAAKFHRLRIIDTRRFLMEQTHQKIRWRYRRADHFQLLDRIQKDIGAVPVFGVFFVDHIFGQQIAAFAAATLSRDFRAGFGHVLQHDASRPPMLTHARLDRLAKLQREARGQLFGLGKIGFG
mmetsp:Transcript_1801/g.3065  ORF Transcript_1801/g.3065 Transcript_1801/m.3065 type:complete len:213 (-) Transcript_1801:492-1130(-)